MKKTIASLLEELLTRIAPLSVALSIIGSLFLVFVLMIFVINTNYTYLNLVSSKGENYIDN